MLTFPKIFHVLALTGCYVKTLVYCYICLLLNFTYNANIEKKHLTSHYWMLALLSFIMLCIVLTFPKIACISIHWTMLAC